MHASYPDIQIIEGDITSATFGIVAHQVNCQKAMNSGVARAIKNRWPRVYTEYMNAPSGAVMLGKSWLVPVGPELLVANVYSQFNFGNDGKKYTNVSAVETGLAQTFEFAVALNLPVILPFKYGSDRGGADWNTEIYPLIEDLACKYRTQVIIYRLQ